MKIKDYSEMNQNEKKAYFAKVVDLLDFAHLLTSEKTEDFSQILACLRIQQIANLNA